MIMKQTTKTKKSPYVIYCSQFQSTANKYYISFWISFPLSFDTPPQKLLGQTITIVWPALMEPNLPLKRMQLIDFTDLIKYLFQIKLQSICSR